MSHIEQTDAPLAEIKINGVEIGLNNMIAFEWKAMLNGGYIVRARVNDPWHDGGSDKQERIKAIKKEYLKKGRLKEPIKVEFRIGWGGGDKKLKMEKFHIAYLTDLEIYGNPVRGQFEFVAIDPSNWRLNQGNSNGKVYKGKISEVIKQVVKDYASEITLEITETNDNNEGRWAMMRMDPQKFIKSLLEWSCHLHGEGGKETTNWMINTLAKDGKIQMFIKQQHELCDRAKNYGFRSAVFNSSTTNDIQDYSIETNNFLSSYQMRVSTQGISSVSGKFLDKKVEQMEDKTEIKDENTGKKLNAKMDMRKSFEKPTSDNSTSVIAIPEHNGGDIGHLYEDYIGGMARNLYLNMIPSVMRLRVRLRGDYRIEDPDALGVSVINLNWRDEGESEEERYFLDGHWLVYGFHHEMTRKLWSTHLYLYRLDYNADAQTRSATEKSNQPEAT